MIPLPLHKHHHASDARPGADVSSGPYHYPGGLLMPAKGILDYTQAKETFGYDPKYDIRRGLEGYIGEWKESKV
jgi:hypothetical protein